ATPAPPTSTTAVTVTAPPPPRIVETKTTTTATVPPPPITQSAAPPPPHEELTAITVPPPAAPDAHEHLRLGQRAMFDRDFPAARAEYGAAWLDKDRLDAHDRHLVRLGMAVVNGNRQEAR